ncbi:MAG: lasso peptide biosynthesis B2 protein [Proteobacteria bacterium]|nr:lasso peptide biosynthesis B2 protein [Pseudomonadota bacterium]
MAEVPTAIQRRRPLVYRLTRRFIRVSGRQRGAVVEAVAALALARLALMFLPFHRIAAWFGTAVSPKGDEGAQLQCLDEAQIERVRVVSWAVTRAARYVPFRAVCLPQAIAAMALLKRRGIASVMHFGVRKEPGKALDAHAWLDAGGIEVTGYPVSDGFVEVVRFL